MAASEKHGGFKRLIGDASNPTLGISLPEIGQNTSQALHIIKASDASTDWNVSAYSDPTLVVHAADDNAATDYIKIWHDDTDANIDAYGATAINFGIGGTNYLEISSSGVYPTTTDGMSLGTSSLNFSDLFLDSGGVINFDGGDVTFTHSAGKLTMGGDGAVTLDLDGASMDVDLPSGCVDKADLASEVYSIEHLSLTGNTNDFDNQTVKLSSVWSDCTVVRVCYFTSAAIGTSLGIDILDGSTDGSGTDVIDSCSDNLNGSDVNTLTTPYALSADDYVNVKFDNLTDGVDFTIDIQLKVPTGAAT